MTNYKCEELSLCENFQAAICLHCNRRLCILHITEHDKIVLNDVKAFSNEIEIIFQQIKNQTEKRKIIYNDLLLKSDERRKQQLEKIEQIYKDELQLIKHEGDALEDFHQDLLKQLEYDARQPLERVQRQQNANIEILNHIRQTIEKVREDSVDLKWEFPAPSPRNTEIPLTNFPLIPTTDTNKSVQKQSTTSKTASFQLASTSKNVKLVKGRPRKRLVRMFFNISSIKQSKDDIAAYKGGRKLLFLVNAYLAAWHRTSKVSEKTFLLNEHISTIQKYQGNRKNGFDVLVGIQAFFFNENFHENKSEMMTFLLKFFLYHQCINQTLILNWYYNNDAHGYMGYQDAKQLAEPFINSLN